MEKKKKSYIIESQQQLEIQGFKSSLVKKILTCISILVSCGTLWILMSWKKRFYMCCSHTRCTLKEADKLLLVDNYNQDYIVNVSKADKRTKGSKFFYFKRLKYHWNEEESTYTNLGGLKIEKCSDFHTYARGLDDAVANCHLSHYGNNNIHIAVKSVVRLIIREVVSPFYIYQVFIVIIWFLQYYYQFGVCIIVLSIISVASTVWETRKQSRLLRDAMKSEALVTVLRDGTERNIASTELVPGDLIILSGASTSLSCDSVLVSGNCVVNESMLTGESIPITKVPVSEDDDSPFDISLNKRNILSCGTELLISRSTDNTPVKAVVFRTGYSTAKGELVRAILYPKPVKIKLHTDLLKCVVIFFILGIPALIYSGIVCSRIEAYSWDVALFLLNTITFFLPPALPAVLTSINEQAQRRLRKEGIFCLNTRNINVAGGLDLMCFDKTGTLTEDSLDISFIVPSVNGKFGNASKSLEGPAVILKNAFACCHSLSNINGQLAGYDLDIKMFKTIGWELLETSNGVSVPFNFLPERIVCSDAKQNHDELAVEEEVIALVRQFPFESSFKRMSVVAKSSKSHRFDVYLKGAPEIIATLCHKNTVPEDLQAVLQTYSIQGFRIIAFASKTFNEDVSLEDVYKMKREVIEKDMTFLGLLVLENKLKKETVPALKILNEANIRMIMVTGDNLLTAITVSRNCGILEKRNAVILVEACMLPDFVSNHKNKFQVSYKYVTSSTSHFEQSKTDSDSEDVKISIDPDEKLSFAMEGNTFKLLRTHESDLLEKIILKCAVFARMSPDQKLYLIEMLQNLGYQVGMCGDGANDCGALKTANTGVSLSMAEASVAAPFTSTQQNVQCISTIIREGRATLVSTFDAFKYMVCYTFMFLVAVLMLLKDGQRPSDGAYLIIDVIVNLLPPFLIGATGAYHGLSKKQPARSVLSFTPLFSIFSFLFIQICILAAAYEYCLAQTWYEGFAFNKEKAKIPDASYSGTTILTMNLMCYITASIIFPSGKPFRNGFFTNKIYVSVVFVQFLLVTVIYLYPPNFFLVYLNFKRAPTISYNFILFGASLLGMLFCFVWEKYFVQRFLSNYLLPNLRRRRGPVRKYDKLLRKLSEEDWNPMTKNQ